MFHVQERRAWIRTRTHTVVLDRDPDFPRFEQDPSGTVERLLRIWLAESDSEKPSHLRAYLGTVTFCAGRPSYRELIRLYRRTSTHAPMAGMRRREILRALSALIRRYE